jgi:hypothetical protein
MKMYQVYQYLNIPIERKGHPSCFRPFSEISCKQVLKACETIKKYEETIKSIQEKDQKYFYHCNHALLGQGNVMMHDVIPLLLSIMSNRKLLIRADLFENETKKELIVIQHPDIVIQGTMNFPKRVTEKNKYRRYQPIPSYLEFTQKNITQIIHSDSLVVGFDFATPSSLLYANEDVGKFAIEHFGLHAVYFLSNWADSYMNSTEIIVANITRNKSATIGIHLRGIQSMMHYISPFSPILPKAQQLLIETIQKGFNYFYIAADDQSIIQQLDSIFPNKIIQNHIQRKHNKFHDQVVIDMCLLEHADYFIGAYRSTLSFMIHSRCGKSPVYFEKLSDKPLQLFHSQAGATSIFYQQEPLHPWTPKYLIHLMNGKDHVNLLRTFFSYLQI